MAWRGPEFDGEVPTLGASVGEWIEAHCVIPDQDHAGMPYRLTDEMWNFLLHHYRLEPDATESKWGTAFHYRRSQLVRPQKWGKGPFSAAIICAEALELIERDPAQAERFYGNRIVQGMGTWLPDGLWERAYRGVAA